MSAPRPLTITELAESLGVSSMTVHRAIAGKPDIAPKTRERILAEIERLGWRPNIAARGLRQGKTFTLGVLVSNVAASFLPEILQGVDRTAEEKGYHTIVCVHEHELPRAERHLQLMGSKGVDGIVYYPTLGSDGYEEEAALLNQVLDYVPVVTIMRRVPGFHGSSVTVDDYAGGRLAAGHLLALGHTRVGTVGYERSDLAELRLDGFAEALHQAGVPLPERWSVRVPRLGVASEAVQPLLTGAHRPTALFCTSDRLAALTIQSASALGLTVPGDLSVLGYNGEPWTELLPVPLSTLVQPREAVGREAARLVLDDRRSGGGAVHVVLPPTPLWRGTTAPPEG